jgi:hypothetical protein
VLAGVLRDRGAGDPPAPLLWSVVVAGPQLVGVLPLLAATALRGPVGAWSGFWLDPVARGAFVLAATVASAWVLAAPAWSGTARLRRGPVAVALAGAGRRCSGSGAGDPGRAGTAAHGAQRRLQVVPGGLSRILGITVHLGVPDVLPAAAAVAGGAAWLAAGALLVGVRRRARRLEDRSQAPSTVSATSSHSAST